MPISSRFAHAASVLLVALSVAPAYAQNCSGPIAPKPMPLTAAEKQKVHELLVLMHKMALADGPGETLDGCLNPSTQAGSLACYERVQGLGPNAPPVPARISDAIRHYGQMLRQDKLVKDPCNKGAWTCPEPGLGNDVVAISGPQLSVWCNPALNPRQRAIAKFQTMASLANEITHVFQKPPPQPAPPAPPLTQAQKDPYVCDDERDSDIMSVKFMQRLLDRLTTSAGTAHTTLHQIELEDHVGECIARCLMNLGVTSQADLAAVTDWAKWKLAFYQDRKTNLFDNAINNSVSWRALYYGGRYRSQVETQVDTSMIGMRIVKLTLCGNTVSIAIPPDGKTPVTLSNGCNLLGQPTTWVLTRGSDGSICYHIWTDTDGDGLPDTGPISGVIPTPPLPGALVQFRDVDLFQAPLGALGYLDALLAHDRRNGTLVAFALNPAGIPTGQFQTLFVSPLIADPATGNPGAGGYRSLDSIDDEFIPGSIRFIFRFDELVNATPDSSAVVGLYTPGAGIGILQPPNFFALALAPNNPFGLSRMPYLDEQLFLMGNPGDVVRLDSIGYGSPQVVTIGSIPPNGLALAGQPLIQQGPDLYQYFSLIDGRSIQYAQSRLGAVADVVDAQVIDGPNPDVLVLSTFPGRITVFSGDPAPAYFLRAEIATEEPDPGMFDIPASPGPLFLANATADVQLHPIAFSPLIAQSLVDLDGDGLADDAAVIARPGGTPTMQVFTVLNAASALPTWFTTYTLPIEPAGFSYIDIDHDNRADLRITDAAGGPAICLVSQGPLGFALATCPNPCPADYNHSGSLSVQDIFDFLNGWFAGNPQADFNGGGLSVSDIFDFLNAWFVGC